MKVAKTAQGYFKVDIVDGEEAYVPISKDQYEQVLNAQKIKRDLMRAGGNGVAIAGGMAAGEALIATGATAAEATVVAVESIALVPLVLTGAAIVGVGALCVWGYKKIAD
jgi:hypothetical protein